jgi:hypothetical protein
MRWLSRSNRRRTLDPVADRRRGGILFPVAARERRVYTKDLI